jgi:hypothetical protein
MKKLFFALSAVLIASGALFADAPADTEKKQDNPPTTLLGGTDIHLSGYGAPMWQFTKIGNKFAHLAGIRGGLIMNDSFVVGLSGYGLAYPSKRAKLSGDTYTGSEPYMNFGYGGLLLEYHFMPKSLVNFSVGTTIGGGGIGFSEKYKENDDNDRQGVQKKFFVIEPEIGAYVNVVRFCRLGVLASYRFTKGANTDEFKDKDFRSFGGSVAAEFGWF